jgi:hypothetical protein
MRHNPLVVRPRPCRRRSAVPNPWTILGWFVLIGLALAGALLLFVILAAVA